MAEIKIINAENKNDINIPNEPFPLFGRIVPSFSSAKWNYKFISYPKEQITEMCFPNENYDYDALPDNIFIGAYDGDHCIGLAVLRPGFFKYMYLYDLKVRQKYRGRHIGKMLIEKAKEVAAAQGYCGLYTQGQDNNPGACLFYMSVGFYIGGLDTNVYRHTEQEGKSDMVFYCDIAQ